MNLSQKYRKLINMRTKMILGMTLTAVSLTAVLMTACGCAPGTQTSGQGVPLVIVGSVVPVYADGRDELKVGVTSLELHDIHGIEDLPYMVFFELDYPITQQQFSAISEHWDPSRNTLYLKVEATEGTGMDVQYQGRLLGFKVVDNDKRVEVLNGFTALD